MSTLVIRTVPARLLVWPAALTSLALVASGAGLAAPVVPLVGVMALGVLLAVPMRWTALSVLVVALVADNPAERPMEGHWKSPLYALGDLLFENLHKHTGIEALRFCALELMIALLVAIVVVRKAMRDPIDDPRALGALPSPMKNAFGFFFAAIVFLELYGLARGGDFKNSLWQVRELFWLPLLGVLFGHAFKSAGARVALLRALMAVAWVRCLNGLYFYVAVARPQHLHLEYVMTHSDSVLIVVAMLIGLAAVVERPSSHHILLNLVLQPVLVAGLLVNDRRLAFVGLGAGLVSLVVMGPPAILAFVKRSVRFMVPFALVYVVVGWNSNAKVFGPVATFRSMATSEDASSQTRDIENYNLIQTLKRNPLIGSGFGHEYIEVVQANRVDQYFAQYRYIAHNSVLWLLSLSGWLGFTAVWAVFPAGALIAFRVHRDSLSTVDRLTAYAATAAILCFVVQAWGDMGLQSWMATLVVTSLMGATGAIWTGHRRTELTTCTS